MSRVVVLAERSRHSANGHEQTPGKAGQRGVTPSCPTDPPHVNAWSVDLMALVKNTCHRGCCAPATCNVRLLINVNPVLREYEIGIYSDGWDPCFVLRERFRPDETQEQTVAREARLRLINDLLSMSYGVAP